ncbi:MAG: hypothetical protein V4644_00120 [Patescibacteria group bacterium]
MEGPNIVPFPGAAERRERAEAKARLEAIESGSVAELAPSLDLAKAVGIRRAIEQERVSLPLRFSQENFSRANAAIEPLTLSDAIRELNAAEETQVRLDPVRHAVLLELVESRILSSQDDE